MALRGVRNRPWIALQSFTKTTVRIQSAHVVGGPEPRGRQILQESSTSKETLVLPGWMLTHTSIHVSIQCLKIAPSLPSVFHQIYGTVLFCRFTAGVAGLMSTLFFRVASRVPASLSQIVNRYALQRVPSGASQSINHRASPAFLGQFHTTVRSA